MATTPLKATPCDQAENPIRFINEAKGVAFDMFSFYGTGGSKNLLNHAEK
jgi:hypothetical protein